jgi:hypothetical protein
VLDVAPGPTLEVLARGEAARLESLGPTGVPLLFAFAERMLATSEEFDREALAQLGYDTVKRAIALREQELDPSDVDGRLADIRTLRSVVNDKRFVMGLLVDLETRFPHFDVVREELLALDCRKYHGQWMTYGDFKSLQGFTRFHGQWVSHAEKDFVKTIDEYRKRRDAETILRRRLPREYEILSSRGETALGMTTKEVHAALGYPDRVYRHRGGGVAFTQWVYGDAYYYFAGDLLFHLPAEK